MSIREEGSVTFWLRHKHADWTTNSNGYSFGNIDTSEISVDAVKHPDRTIELTVSGPLGKDFTLRYPIPKCDARGLFVAITWESPEVKLYLNGGLAGSITLSESDKAG